MEYKVDKEIDLSEYKIGNYIISSQHRKKSNPNKSIWTITYKEEVECFIFAFDKKWNTDNEGWGLKIYDGLIQEIGQDFEYKKLKIAKFVDGNQKNVWHGYPVDHMIKPNDRPTTEILKAWVDKGYLTKAKMCKIKQGKSCNL